MKTLTIICVITLLAVASAHKRMPPPDQEQINNIYEPFEDVPQP